MSYKLIIIRYGEIALKAKHTRKHFENILINNIKLALKSSNIKYSITKEWGRMYLNTDYISDSIRILKKIFGIVSISPSLKIKTNIDIISKKILDLLKDNLNKNTTFALRVKRVGKHNFTSQDIAVKIGEYIVTKTKSKVDLTYPDYEIFIDIRDENTYIFLEKIPGIGGMPLGSQGRVLAFIDNKKSILAAWYIIRRGCKPIFYLKNIIHKDTLNSFIKNWYIDTNIYNGKFGENENLKISEIIKKENCQAIITAHRINSDKIIFDLKEIKNIFNLPVLCPLIIMNEDVIYKELNDILL